MIFIYSFQIRKKIELEREPAVSQTELMFKLGGILIFFYGFHIVQEVRSL
jgi:hypothetical protein